MKRKQLYGLLIILAIACVGVGWNINHSGNSKNKTNVTILQAEYPQYDTAPDLVGASDLVFQGTVRNIKYQMLDVSTEKGRDQDTGLLESEAMPYTLYTIDVEKVYKGTIQTPTVTIKRPGGNFGNNEYIVEDASEISAGRDYFALNTVKTECSEIINELETVY
ncbi:MAG: hypothetical protein HFH59_16985 [Lachnospiraceae bacterium]|nr:hypothetical protein [Lachnospiraceae bacterium]